MTIPTWTKPEELEWLATRAAEHHSILEIGTHRGASALAMANATAGTVVCFDKCDDAGVEEEAKRNLAEHIASGRVKLVHADAGVSAVKWLQHYTTRFDMIWIDDGHTFADVVRDCMAALLLRVDEKALICGHDAEWHKNGTPCGEVSEALAACWGWMKVKRGPGSIWYL